MDQLRDLRSLVNHDSLQLRVLVGENTKYQYLYTVESEALAFEEDRCAYRGTGGLLRDVAEDYDDDDWLLVVLGAQFPLRNLTKTVLQLSESGGDVNVIADKMGKPAPLVLLRTGALRSLPKVGYVDFKEQALEQLQEEHRVKVAIFDQEASSHLRTMHAYLDALRHLYGGPYDEDGFPPFAERWRPTFSIIESQAIVGRGAKIFDSVILAGGRVASGATVVRSVVAPGGRVQRGRIAMDQLVMNNHLPSASS